MLGPLMTGAFLSTWKGPNDPCAGCGAEVFPATSFTVTGGMVALFVSVPLGTLVVTEKEDGPTRPDPPELSLAVHGTETSVICQAGAGATQLTAGAVISILTTKARVEVLTLFPLFVTWVSIVLALSVAKYRMVVVPSLMTGTLIDPLNEGPGEPVSTPEAGEGRLSPVAE